MENGAAGRQAPAAPKKPKLTRLKIESFRNVEPCELRFGDGFNVLLGLNATGKTTLLELIVAALSFDFSKFRNEAFTVEYDLSFSTGTIAVSMRSERVEQPPLLQVRDADRFARSAKLKIHSESPAKEWVVCADASSIWNEGEPHRKRPLPMPLGERGSYPLFWVINMTADKSLMRAYVEELWPWLNVSRFDEALDMFRDITSQSTWIEVMVDPNRKVHGFSFGGLLPKELSNAAEVHVLGMSNESGQGLTISAESLGFLRGIGELFGFKTARLEMRLESKSAKGLKFSDFRFMFEDHDGSVIRHENLSYGQKRLLAFYYYLAASPITVIADELVDGLHHLWIDASIEAIGDRQAFLASQNPLLLDHLEFDSAEQVASTFITCRAERQGDDKRMIWSNLSVYDADRFFRAYKVDVAHVSEILLSKGLW
jgi:AAA domain